jgi:hypothetical protein
MFARLPMIAVLVEPRDCTRLRSGVPGNDMSRITAGGQGKASCELRITERPQRGAKNLPNLVKITSRDVDTFSRFSPALEPRFTFRGADVPRTC